MQGATQETLEMWALESVKGYALGDPCLVEGCGKLFLEGGGGRGYCASHYRSLLRTGHAEPLRVRAGRDLRDAALAWAADPSRLTLGALMHAAWATKPQSGVPTRPERPINPEHAARLVRAAEEYADCDTNPEADQLFEELGRKLDREARRFANHLAVGGSSAEHLRVYNQRRAAEAAERRAS